MSNVLTRLRSAARQTRAATAEAAGRTTRLSATTLASVWGNQLDEVVPSDPRFSDSAWTENAAAFALQQQYLINSHWFMELADAFETMVPDPRHRVRFWTRQYVDALSPANLALTNPEAWREFVRTGGRNVAKGTAAFARDLRRGRITQVPQDAFVVGRDLAATPGRVVYRSPLIELIQYSPTTDTVATVPLLVVAPWINKYYVMDLHPHNSMFKYLVDSGFTVFAISWKNPDAGILELDWDDYMDQGPLAAQRVVSDITGCDRVNFLGYCLGGLMTQVTVAYLAAHGDKSANTATYLTTHQDFTDIGDIAVFLSRAGVRYAEWMMRASGGYLDGRRMSATFNMLRSNDLIWRYVVNDYLLGKDPPAIDLLYWNSDGTRIPGKVHSFLMREFFLGDKLRRSDELQIKETGIDLGRIEAPTYVVAADNDHIVPWRGAFQVRELQRGPVRFVLANGGHIAGIINPPADNKRSYLTDGGTTRDPDEWSKNAVSQPGSWWGDWVAWLTGHSGDPVPPPPMGSDKHPPIAAAPGTYVLER